MDDVVPPASDLVASVIVPTWNGARFLGPCLDALRRQTLWPWFEVIVVDGASTDATPAVLEVRPWARVVSLTSNRGFAAAANAGIAAARAPVIVLLNNDTEAEAGWLAALLAALEEHPAAAMATSKVTVLGRPGVLHTTGDTVDLAGRPRNRGAWEVDTGQWDDRTEVFGANGAAAAYRRGMLETVGNLETAFGSYLEDVDLAWRGQMAGFGCVYAPRAVVAHHVSATGGGTVASYLVARNRVWLIARNYPSGLLVRHIGTVARGLVAEAREALAAWRGAEARATLRGLAVGLLTWPRMLAARRRIQARRVLTDAELEALLS